MKTTNYINTFIQVADDCPVNHAEVPPEKKEKTAANLQFEMLYEHPYKYTSDDVIFQVYATKQGIKGKKAIEDARNDFFSKGQPCMRSSPLTKRYGWGVHSNEEGKIALFARESKDYKKLAADKSIAQVKAMRSKRD